jgi:anaerobic dimethyl sulfoxide reductase subunit A
MSDNNFLEKALTNTVLNRRSFLKWNAALGGTAVLAKGGLSFGLEPTAKEAAARAEDESIVWSACLVNCGSRCPLRLHVRDGEIVQVETDNTGDDEYGQHQMRCCVRGRSVRQRIYNPDRLKYPMKRVGKRGEGKFERITWEEAYDTIASELQRIIDEYGNEAVYINYATGALGGTVHKSWPPGSSPIARLMNCVGGYLNHYGTYSSAQASTAHPFTYGGRSSNSILDIVNSKLLVYFGNNLCETSMGGGGGKVYHIQQLKEISDVKIIVIDPRYSETTVSVADEWIPIRPGTDAALVTAMAYVMINEDLHDQEFLDTYCVGFDEDHMPEGIPSGNSYKAYVMGDGDDGVPKTPEWAAEITGIPAETIIRLAREIAVTKPTFISQGLGPQRHFNGEQNCRAISLLAILTGNVGIHGGNSGVGEGGFGVRMQGFPTLDNPVETSISVFTWFEAIQYGPEMTALNAGVRGADKLGAPLKFMWNYAGNTIINQHSDSNGTIELLQDESKCEMIVVIDNHMTASAKVADILLPDITNYETNELTRGGAGNMGFAVALSKAIEPMFECKPVYEMCTEIAKRLGVEEQFTEGRTHQEWLEWCVEQTRENDPDFPDYQTFKEMGIYKVAFEGEPSVAYQDFREAPEDNPLRTKTGKIEIFSEDLWDIANTWELEEHEVITAIPTFAPAWDPDPNVSRDQYPLQMIGHHYRQRTHSSYGNVEWLKKAIPQEVWINPVDAEKRDIKLGDKVHVFNDRGKMRLPAKVTSRIAPGVISVPQGAWYEPNDDGVDEGGCVNTLTAMRPSPLAKANPQHTNLVEVEKA